MLTVAVIAALMVFLWRSWATRANPDDLDGIVRTLQKHRIASYRDQSWCRYIFRDGRGYSTNFTSSTCNPSRFAAEPFNEEGEALFRAVRRSIKKAGLDVRNIHINYSRDGIIRSAELVLDTLFGSDSYVYDRDGTPFPPDYCEVTRLGTHWFFVHWK